MQKEIEILERRIRELETKINEINKRMPAHSVKPPIMHELFDLEDERDAAMRKIEKLKHALNLNRSSKWPSVAITLTENPVIYVRSTRSACVTSACAAAIQRSIVSFGHLVQYIL